ncbi:hypothetical protein HDU96_007200 [Phlyctochytrium bullatum]|nr:hypothetical protein HDU96_007200 [Phlyctochytrium bullatum]
MISAPDLRGTDAEVDRSVRVSPVGFEEEEVVEEVDCGDAPILSSSFFDAAQAPVIADTNTERIIPATNETEPEPAQIISKEPEASLAEHQVNKEEPKPVKGRRGRPPKKSVDKAPKIESKDETESKETFEAKRELVTETAAILSSNPPRSAKKGGRPRKLRSVDDTPSAATADSQDLSIAAGESAERQHRSKKPKQIPEVSVSDVEMLHESAVPAIVTTEASVNIGDEGDATAENLNENPISPSREDAEGGMVGGSEPKTPESDKQNKLDEITGRSPQLGLRTPDRRLMVDHFNYTQPQAQADPVFALEIIQPQGFGQGKWQKFLNKKLIKAI